MERGPVYYFLRCVGGNLDDFIRLYEDWMLSLCDSRLS